MANEIRGIMMPVAEEKKVLLPNAIIAEVVSYKNLERVDGSPNWLSGKINWRGYDLPVICYNSLSTGTPNANNKSGRVAIIKALGNMEEMPYFAMIVSGVPRLQLVTQGDLQVHQTDDNENNAIASKVTIQDEMLEIPNIRFIEHVLDIAIS